MMRRKSNHNHSVEVTRRHFMLLAGGTAIGAALPGCSREPATPVAMPPPPAPAAGLLIAVIFWQRDPQRSSPSQMSAEQRKDPNNWYSRALVRTRSTIQSSVG